MSLVTQSVSQRQMFPMILSVPLPSPSPPPNLSYMGTLDQFLKGDCPFNPGKESFPNLKKMVLIKDTSAIILETVPLTQFHVLPGRLSL